jgi:hypothetical protein
MPLRRFGFIGSGLVVAALAGFLLGSCGGGDGSALTTGLTATRPAATATRPSTTVLPTRTVPTLPAPATEPVTTEEFPDTTTNEPETTAPSPTVTVTETTETTAPTPTEPVTTESTPTTTAEAAEPTSSDDDTPWGWIALGVALATAALVGLLLWRRRRAEAETWAGQLGDLSRRTLVALDDVLRDGSVVTGRIQALTAEAGSLESRAPDDAARATAGRLRGRLDELATTLEADRTLRLSSPPPSPEQLSYSTALIRQQAEHLQGVLRPPPSAGPPS